MTIYLDFDRRESHGGWRQRASWGGFLETVERILIIVRRLKVGVREEMRVLMIVMIIIMVIWVSVCIALELFSLKVFCFQAEKSSLLYLDPVFYIN